MRKPISVFRTPVFFFLLLTILVGASFLTPTQAKARAAAGKAKAAKSTKSAAGKAATKATPGKKGKAAREVVARGGRRGKVVAAREGRGARGRAGRVGRRGRAAEPEISDKQARLLMGKRGRLSKAERRVLTSYRSSRRARARAIQLARIRAVQAHDAALRNVAADNIAGDITAGEDPEIRAAALNALQGRSGTVVVMDPLDGRVYTVVNQQMALRSPVKPCSTVKMITSLAALHEGVFDPNQDMRSAKYGTLNLTDAIARSDNGFFDTLGKLLGYDRVVKYAGNYGFGQKTGVNYPGESDGFLPEDDSGRICSFGDGFGVTAIQLAAFTSAIANGGNLYVPRVPRSAAEAENFTPVLKRRIEMSQEDRLRLLAGMSGAVNYGTARRAFNALGQVAGKTGTCTEHDKLRLFTSFSSVDNPRLVVTVITTDSKMGGNHASEIAGRIYAAISPRFFRDRTTLPAAAAVTELPTDRVHSNMEK